MKLRVLEHLRVARSEQWRWRWAFRTAVSIAAISFLALFKPTRDYLTQLGRHAVGPAFAGLVTGMSKDRLLGSTLANSWNFCMSCFLACLMCWVVAVIKNETIGPSGRTPDGALLAIIFGFVLVLQLMELPTVGNKLY
jgi:hypothetical protein